MITVQQMCKDYCTTDVMLLTTNAIYCTTNVMITNNKCNDYYTTNVMISIQQMCKDYCTTQGMITIQQM